MLFDMVWFIKNFPGSGKNVIKKLAFHNLFLDSKFHNSFNNNGKILIFFLLKEKLNVRFLNIFHILFCQGKLTKIAKKGTHAIGWRPSWKMGCNDFRRKGTFRDFGLLTQKISGNHPWKFQPWAFFFQVRLYIWLNALGLLEDIGAQMKNSNSPLLNCTIFCFAIVICALISGRHDPLSVFTDPRYLDFLTT